MLSLTLVSQFGIIPRMDSIRASIGEIDAVPADLPRASAIRCVASLVDTNRERSDSAGLVGYVSDGPGACPDLTVPDPAVIIFLSL